MNTRLKNQKCFFLFTHYTFSINLPFADHHPAVEQTCHGYRTGHVDSRQKDDEERRLPDEGRHDDAGHVLADLGRKAPHSGHHQAKAVVDRQATLHPHHPRKRELREASCHSPGRG
jgi:hypothetical protein